PFDAIAATLRFDQGMPAACPQTPGSGNVDELVGDFEVRHRGERQPDGLPVALGRDDRRRRLKTQAVRLDPQPALIRQRLLWMLQRDVDTRHRSTYLSFREVRTNPPNGRASRRVPSGRRPRTRPREATCSSSSASVTTPI